MADLTPPPPVLWEASFDESGKLADSEIVVFGGCMGPREAVEDFGTKWVERLRRDGLQYTSMKEAIHFQGPYVDWKANTDKRDAVLRDLAKLLGDSSLLMMSSPITTSEFKALPSHQQKKLGNDPQYCGFEACIVSTLSQAPNLVLHAVCDLSEQYAERCITLFNTLRKRNETVKARCFALTFADDTRHSGLQAADMIAYCSRADHQRSTKTPVPIVEEIIGILNSHGGNTNWFVWKAGSEGLGHGEIEPAAT